MKGYLACMLRADHAASRDLREPLKLVFSCDEEIGCVGIQHMTDPRACFVGKPTEMQVAIEPKGKAAIRAVCRG